MTEETSKRWHREAIETKEAEAKVIKARAEELEAKTRAEAAIAAGADARLMLLAEEYRHARQVLNEKLRAGLWALAIVTVCLETLVLRCS